MGMEVGESRRMQPASSGQIPIPSNVPPLNFRGTGPLFFGRGFSARIIAPMTPARKHAKGLATPSLSQLLLTAMLRAFVELVSRFFIRKEPDPQPSFPGKAEGRIPGIPVGPTRGLATDPLEAINQDARDKPGHDPMAEAQITSGTPTPLIPTKVGTQGSPRSLSRLGASAPRSLRNRSWIPTPHPEPARSAESKGVAMSGSLRDLRPTAPA
jgi:hypothetical protein